MPWLRGSRTTPCCRTPSRRRWSARDGSIDWLTFPRFDSAACFAALLGTEDNGRWQIAPAGEVTEVRRRYRDDSLVLETEFHTADGVVAVIDCIPVATGPSTWCAWSKAAPAGSR